MKTTLTYKTTKSGYHQFESAETGIVYVRATRFAVQPGDLALEAADGMFVAAEPAVPVDPVKLAAEAQKAQASYERIAKRRDALQAQVDALAAQAAADKAAAEQAAAEQAAAEQPAEQAAEPVAEPEPVAAQAGRGRKGKWEAAPR